jgi:DNA-binding MarR family transcriptional regulator
MMAMGRSELPAENERKLRALIRILDEFAEMPTGMAAAFLRVALEEGTSLREVVEKSGKPQSTTSRYLLDLGDRNRQGGPGHGLVAWRIAPEELRRKEYTLTVKGKALLHRILSDLALATR